jgi:hypothetical protein
VRLEGGVGKIQKIKFYFDSYPQNRLSVNFQVKILKNHPNEETFRMGRDISFGSKNAVFHLKNHLKNKI